METNCKALLRLGRAWEEYEQASACNRLPNVACNQHVSVLAVRQSAVQKLCHLIKRMHPYLQEHVEQTGHM